MAEISGTDPRANGAEKEPNPKETTEQLLGAKLDAVGITGLLRSAFIENALNIALRTSFTGNLQNGMAYPMAMKAYAEDFRLMPETVEFEFQIGQQQFPKQVAAALESGVSRELLANAYVAYNSTTIAAAAFGVAGIFEAPNLINKLIEGHGIAKAKQIAPSLQLALVSDPQGVRVEVEIQGSATIKLDLSFFTKSAEATRTLPQQISSEEFEQIKPLLKVGFDQQLVLCIAAAAHLAQIPGSLNSRGLLIPFSDNHKTYGVEDKFEIGKSLSAVYNAIQQQVQFHGLEEFPTFGILLGGN